MISVWQLMVFILLFFVLYGDIPRRAKEFKKAFSFVYNSWKKK